jgi:hypothetical protein
LNLLRWYQGNCLCIFLSLYERDEREEREERDNRRRRRVTLTRTTQNYKTETRSTRKQRACATTAATTTTTTRRTEKKQQHNKRRNKPQALASALSLYHSLCVACEFANVFGLCAFLLPPLVLCHSLIYIVDSLKCCPRITHQQPPPTHCNVVDNSIVHLLQVNVAACGSCNW